MADGPPRGRVIVARKICCREAIYQARKQKPRKEQAARIVYGSTMRLAKTLRGLAAKQGRSRRGAHIGARLTLMRFGSFRPIFGNFLWLLLALVSDVRPPKPWAHAPPTRPMRVPALRALCSCGLLTLSVSLCQSHICGRTARRGHPSATAESALPMDRRPIRRGTASTRARRRWPSRSASRSTPTLLSPA